MTVMAQADCADSDCMAPVASESETIRVGYTQFAPYSGTSKTSVAEGYLVDLMRLLAEPLGYTLQFVPHDNPGELLDSLEAGLIDVTSPLSFNSDREIYGRFTEAVHVFSLDLFIKRGGREISSLTDLQGLRVAVSQGSQAERRVRTIEGAIAVPVASSRELLLPLLSGDVDVVAAPAATVYYQLKRTGLGGRVESSDFNLNQFLAGFLVDRSHERLLIDLNSAIAQAQAQGHIKDLYDQWFRPAPDPFTTRESIVLLIALGAVIVGLLYWGWLHYGIRMSAKRATERADSLQEVLNATGATLLLADQNMRPLWWNEAYARNYPDHLPALNKGKSLEALFSSQVSVPEVPGVEGALRVDERIKELMTVGETQNVDHLASGKVLKSKGVKLSSGQYGLVAMDVTALSAAHRELQSNAEQLMESNRNLSEFSHIAAHDLAGPLRSIRNLHKWILDDIADSEVKLDTDVIENFEHINRLIERQSALIDDLLAYASSDGTESPRIFDPGARLASVIDLCEIPKNFEVTVAEDLPPLSADPVGFDIVLRNLISNAVKHHDREAGRIDVSWQRDGDFAQVLVTDDGPGIEPKYKKSVFRPFKTLKSRDRGGGTGLGLAFVERTVGKWGGHISVESDTSVRVTTFSFTVPLAQNNDTQNNVVRIRVG
ncbi:MAG: transporter substrate-binding domain-containing protein [Boseongicola sp.]|nr:transporter substrate-binding domain-containing protein [Boseongicola sp.]